MSLISDSLVERATRCDSRTGLPDRDSFYADIGTFIAHDLNNASRFVLLNLDVDGLEFVLRTCGPAFRDDLIAQVGRRIKDNTGPASQVYHVADGRFGIVPRRQGYRSATQRARALIKALSAPFAVDGTAYNLTPHIGISQYPNHARCVHELVRASMFASHQARVGGEALATFDADWDAQEQRRFRLMVDLETALQREDQLRLAYQPQIDLASGACVGVEALCRWDHPELGPVPPGQFLPVIERTPLMLPLTETVLSTAFDDLVTWRRQGFTGNVALNLSVTLFREADLLARLVEHARFFNLALGNFHFEVTETDVMDQPHNAATTLAAIRDRGSAIAIDDFGTGRSSLAYLADLPIKLLKIDKVFVRNIDKPQGEAVVGAAARMAEKLGLTTIAEGIETRHQYERCCEQGIHVGQGFYMAEPMFKPDFDAWLGV